MPVPAAAVLRPAQVPPADEGPAEQPGATGTRYERGPCAGAHVITSLTHSQSWGNYELEVMNWQMASGLTDYGNQSNLIKVPVNPK